MRNCSIPITLCVAVLLVTTAICQQDDGAIVKDFQSRVSHYLDIRNRQGVPNKQTNSPAKIAEQKKQAVSKGQEARPVARQGEVFAPEVGDYFKRQIQATLNGPGGNAVKASLRRAEPLPNIRLQVNSPYPEKLPLQSTPPTLLLKLPQLPKGLQYRIVGSTLVLYDETTHLIVDLLPGAIS